jgi:hypothetical protein
MSRKQDQRLVNAYERVVKGEPPRLDEAKKGREFTASLAKWATQRAKDVVKGVKFLEDSVKKKSANDILASISGIESHLGEIKKSMATVSEEELNEMGMVIGTPLSRRKDATPTDEAMNPKDKTGEREGYYLDTVNRGVRLMEYGVLSKAEYKKVKDFMKKTITF